MRLKLSVLGIVLVACSGCGTYLARTDPATGWPTPAYSGVKYDSGAFNATIHGVSPPYSLYGVLILDVPFSFVCDTVLLPSDYYAKRTNDREKAICIEFADQLSRNSDAKSNAIWLVCEYKLDKTIRADARNFIEALPTEERSSAHFAYSLAEDNGESAVEIVTFVDKVRWKYILIYDKDKRRRKEIRFPSETP
jgi:uncharacterized protein YceK